MTVSSTTRKAGPFLGNGVATAFPFAFKVFTTTDITLTRVDASGVTTLTLGADYSIALNADQDNNPGGTITYPLSGTPLAVGQTLTGIGNVAASQGADITSLGRFLPQVIENALDRLTILAQQVLEKVNRALSVPVSESGIGALPALASRTGKYLAFDTNGNPIASSGTGTDAGLRTDLATGAAGALLVAFKSAGAGAVLRTLWALLMDLPVSVKNFGAVGDGVTDDTAAIQAALVASRAVVFPATTAFYKVTAALAVTIANQTITGLGFPKVKQETANTHLFSATTVDGVGISGLWMYGATGASSSTACNAINNVGGNKWSVRGNIFERHSGNGFFGNNVADCKIADNTFQSATNTVFCGDVTLWGSSNRNQVRGNSCISGSDQGITLQTIITGDVMDDNMVIDNTIEECTRYGVICYNARDTKTGDARRNRISGNVIRNIYGSTLNTITGSHTYGAGIYVLSAEGVEVSGNTIENTNVNTDSDTLAPAGIGVNSTSCGVVSGNVITNCKYHGIKVQDPLLQGAGSGAGTAFLPDGHIAITGNTVLKAGLHGIYVLDKHNVTISGNTSDQCTQQGIYATSNLTGGSYPTMYSVVIGGNTVTRNGAIGVAIDFCTRPVISGNSINRNTGDGLFLNTVAAAVTGNNISLNSDGIDVRATSSDTLLTGNVIISNNDLGIRGSAEYRDNDNELSGNTNGDYGGTFAVLRTLDNTGIPSVKHGRMFGTGGTTAITDFTNGYVGQVIYIRSAHVVTVTHGASGIRLAGSVNFAMVGGNTLTLIKTGTGTWDEIGRMVR